MATSLVLVSVLLVGTFQGISCGSLIEETKELPPEVLHHIQPVAYPVSNKGHDVISVTGSKLPHVTDIHVIAASSKSKMAPKLKGHDIIPGTGSKLHHVTDIHVIPASSKSKIAPKLKDQVKVQKVLKPKRKSYARKKPMRKRPLRNRKHLIGKRLLQQGKYLKKAIKNALKGGKKISKAIRKNALKKQHKLNKVKGKKNLLNKKLKPKKSRKQLRVLKTNAKKGKKQIGKRINKYRRKWRIGRRYPKRGRRITLRKGKNVGKWRKGAKGRPKITLQKKPRNLKTGLRSLRIGKRMDKMRNALKSILSSMKKDKKLKRKSSLTSNYIRSILGRLPNRIKGKIGRAKRNEPVIKKTSDKPKAAVKPNKPRRRPSLTANYIRGVLGGAPKRGKGKTDGKKMDTSQTSNKIVKSTEKKKPKYKRLRPKDIKDKIKRILARRNKTKQNKVPVITKEKSTATVPEKI